MLNRIKRNLPILAINGALSLFVVFVCVAIGTQDLKAAALLSFGLSLIFTPTLLVLLVVDAVCYHFDVWDKLCAAYDSAASHFRRPKLVKIHPAPVSTCSAPRPLPGPTWVKIPACDRHFFYGE